MYRNKGAVLTLNSLRTLPKVCRFPHLRNINTATERLHFDSSNGLPDERYVNYKGNSEGFYGDNGTQINHGRGGNRNVRENSGHFHRNPDGFRGGNELNWQNPSGVYGKTVVSGKQGDPTGNYGNFDGNYNSFNAFNNGLHQNHNGVDRGMPSGYTGEGQRSEFRHSAVSNFGPGGFDNVQQNVGGFHRNPYGNNQNLFNGNPRHPQINEHQQSLENRIANSAYGDSFRAQQNVNRTNTWNSSEVQRSGNSAYGDSFQAQQNVNRTNTWNSSEVQRSGNSAYGDSFRAQQNVNRTNTWNSSEVQRSGNSAYGDSFRAQQNVNRTNTWNSSELQRSGYSGGNGVAQQNAVRYDVGNSGVSGQTYGNYYAGSPGSFQNNRAWPDANNVGTLPQNVAVVSNNDDSGSGDGHKGLKGTIQELDDCLSVANLEEAVKVLTLLEKQGIVVDLSRYLALMKACGENDSLEEAKAIHEHLIRSVPNLEVCTYNRILEIYSACGSMKDAFRVFDAMPRNLTSWDIMITGLAKNGHPEAAIDLFTELRALGLKPDGQIYLGVFLACKALLDTTEGLLHFEAMSKDNDIVPSIEHYVGVIDMLGSVGHLDEALEFIEKMPIEPGVEVWEKLMNLSRIQGNTELGDRCAELVDLLDPSLLNEQSRAGLLPLKVSDSANMKEKKKEGGQNPLEIRSRVHEYRAGDRSDPDSEKLYALLYGLKEQMKESGYVPELKGVLHDIDPESKEEALLGHSERLAVSRGFLSTPARQPMRVIKNLRICVDCHNAMKIISKLVGRELIMRDAKRFHHFKDGICSCRDYW
ncbi:OLC1v1030261C1 [Oldenlandia corymbosa var. corymbosa]|uniref:OLC1v1030261C1 n=1 Tax=Oldenlandia corymbosa var. corymbosa TaxID=529605 RepID=A0AAV1CHI1_OLDCO|nr:OLC1v1030261C1 [Oldenlandia corymbosa var. corymbosa]